MNLRLPSFPIFLRVEDGRDETSLPAFSICSFVLLQFLLKSRVRVEPASATLLLALRILRWALLSPRGVLPLTLMRFAMLAF